MLKLKICFLLGCFGLSWVCAQSSAFYDKAPHYDVEKLQLVMCCRLEPLPQPLAQELALIVNLFKAHKIDEAMAINENFIPKLAHLLAQDERKAIACYNDMGHVLANLVNANEDKESRYLVARDWVVPYYLRAYGYLENKQIKLAKKALDEALAFAPLDPQILNERAQIFTRQKAFDVAEKDFQKALIMAKRLESNNDNDSNALQRRALRGLGYIAAERKHWDKAEAFYREALTVDKNDVRAKAELLYIEKNRSKKSTNNIKN